MVLFSFSGAGFFRFSWYLSDGFVVFSDVFGCLRKGFLWRFTGGFLSVFMFLCCTFAGFSVFSCRCFFASLRILKSRIMRTPLQEKSKGFKLWHRILEAYLSNPKKLATQDHQQKILDIHEIARITAKPCHKTTQNHILKEVVQPLFQRKHLYQTTAETTISFWGPDICTGKATYLRAWRRLMEHEAKTPWKVAFLRKDHSQRCLPTS